jgi:hypothetical protein
MGAMPGPIEAPLSLWCPPARARAVRPGANNHSCPGVAWVGLYPSELQRCTCPCHLPEDT